MKHNVKIMSILATFILVFEYANVKASNQSNITAIANGTTPKYSSAFDCLRDYPYIYVSSMDYSDGLFAIKRMSPSQESNFINLTVGGTSTITGLGSLDGYTIKAIFKNKTWHLANTISGILFY